MTKNEYHSVLIRLLENSNTDLPLWPPGISPGTLRTGVVMNDLSHSSLTTENQNPIVVELDSIAMASEALDFQLRHDAFLKTLE